MFDGKFCSCGRPAPAEIESGGIRLSDGRYAQIVSHSQADGSFLFKAAFIEVDGTLTEYSAATVEDLVTAAVTGEAV